MNDSARRVALLARPGAARDRMREALDQAGAHVVLEADPTATDQDAVLAAGPEVALVVLDAATDEALDRFEGLLSNPKINVLFEEAELALGRAGWDAARWVRHLSAKLRRSDDVLPPGHGGAGDDPTDAGSRHGAGVAAAAHVLELPADPTPAVREPMEAARPPEPVGGQDASPARSIFADLELVAFETEAPAPAPPPPAFDPGIDLDIPGLDAETVAAAPPPAAEPPPLPFGALELERDDDTPSDIRIEGLELEADHPADASRFQDDMAELHGRIAAMELTEDRPPSAPRGAVLVLAGIGGPDAVRQLLGALPEAFPRPVLVQQRLDGGHYDKLVTQMQRVTGLPVRLAAAGDGLQAGTIYILPPTLGFEDSGTGLVLTDGAGDLFDNLPANDSAVVMLSGSDPAQVDAAMKLAANGALVAAQALDGCYDIAAPAALAARGGQAGKPAELARRLADRWP